MSEFNDREIELAKQLHDLLAAKGKLPEIREGDWFIVDNSEPKLYYISGLEIAHGHPATDADIARDSRRIYLWSWERAREWLREKGYFLAVVNDCNPGKVYFEFAEDKFIKVGKSFGKWGKTDLEAILAVMVAVEEEK